MDKRIDVMGRKTGVSESHVVQQGDTVIPINDAATVKIAAQRSDVVAMVREGDDLILRFADGSAARLDGYFHCPRESIADLIFVDPDAEGEWAANLGASGCYLEGDLVSEQLTYSFEPTSAAAVGVGGGAGIGGATPLWLGGLLVGAGAAAAGGGGGGGGPSGPPPDTTAPAAPVVAPTNGRVLTGTAEANSVVRIDVNGDGTIDGAVVADATGAWSFTLATPLANGVIVRVTAADAAGNVSPPTTVTVDAAAPPAPSVNPSNGAGLSGVAEAGATVRLDLDGDGDIDATTTAGSNGAWSYTPATPLPHGATVIATAVDAVGNASPPTSVVVDGLAPAVPTINPSRGDVLTGSAEAGSTIRLDLDGDDDVDATTTANAAGAWTYTPTGPLANGVTVIVRAADAAGNVSPPASAVIDTTPPAVPAIGVATDDVGALLGPVANGGSTDDTTPTLSGAGAEANAVITIYDNGAAIGTTTANAAGAWSFTPSTALTPGGHSLTISATDAAGNASAQSAAYVITIDTSAPAVPTIGGVDDNVGAILGGVSNGGVTDDTTPTLSGAGAEANATITVYDNGVAIGTTTANAAGVWSFTPGAALTPGGHSLTISATDAAGNASVQSAAYVVTVDTSAPAVPTIGGVDDNAGAILGGVSNGGVTDDTTPTLTGTGAEANATITVYDNGTAIGTTTANAAGAWSFTPSAALTATAHSFTISATDAAGNASAQSAAYVITIDTSAPAVPTIGGVDDNVGAILGGVSNGGVTDDTTPTLSGTGAEANATITVYDNGTAIGTTTANAAGAWSFTPSAALTATAHSFTISATDAAGNASAQSAAYVVTIDTSLPAIPTIGGVTDNVGAILGSVSNGGVTDDTTPTLTGTGAEANATITVYDNGTAIGTTTADAAGAWSFTPSVALAATAHSFTISATDAAGNASAQSTAYVVTIDTSLPAIPTIGGVTDNVGAILGGVSNGGVTDDTTPTLTGTGAEANATITIYDNGTAIGTTTADAAGAWSFTPSAALAATAHSFTISATDAAGNASAQSAAYVVTIDTSLPAIPTIGGVTDNVGAILGGVSNGGVTDDATPTLSGTGAEANATITIYDNGTAIGTTTADAAGAWSFTPSVALAATAHSFTISATDAAGNASAQSAAYVVTVDTSLPAIPTIGDVTDNVGTILGSVSNGGFTDDTTPTLTGTGAEANATITIYDNGTAIGTTTADGAGAWSFTPSAALAATAHSFTITATDAAGNASAQSAAYVVTVDVTSPPVPVIGSVIDNVGVILGTILNGGATDDTLPQLQGAGAQANATITVYDNGVAIGTTTANGAGAWSFTPSTPRSSGVHSFTITATDAAGNSSVQSASYTITIDAIPPAAPTIVSLTDNIGSVIGSVSNGGFTDDTIPVLAGTGAQPNGLVRVFDNGVLIGTTTANGAGAWSFTPGAPLTETSHSFTVTTRDPVGNESAPSAAHVITVDLTAPTATIAITGLSDDTGTLGDWQTDDTSPTISGTLSAALGANERVEISLDGGATWAQATVTGSTWFHGPGTLGLGAHTIGVRVVDAAGNIGNTASQAITVTNVNVAPIVQATSASLLGLVSAEALGLLDLSEQSLVAIDPDGNLQSVVVRYAPLLALNLGAYTLTGSAALAAELGLVVNILNDPGSPGSIAPSSTMTIAKLGGGVIDNLTINEFLKSVHFNQDLTLVGLQVLNSTTIRGTDANGLTTVGTTGSLLDLSLINFNGNPTLIEGTNGANTLNGSALSERIYGYGGNDVLHGGGGDDLIRGGSGADEIYGDGGNDILIYDAADVIIDGGTGTDILLLDSGAGLVMALDAATNVRNMERINLGYGDAGRSISINQAGVLAATDSNRQLIVNGESNDSVTLTGAVYQGQILIDGHAYNQYVLGMTTVLVEDPVVVTVI
ncbi:Ig-like domain-containing protein [Caulobacter mirabilis]|uniref:Large repetitive protein n=1 Tax=Caulobacter mirabilis TaxID=69666 RepID=A0A2D2AYC5_9CAUL|nr:Ig-like domain-containing protein [Caulobacter mirabilis]ATQ42937.1 large repetitive protein [Caulobacter mirabilis]